MSEWDPEEGKSENFDMYLKILKRFDPTSYDQAQQRAIMNDRKGIKYRKWFENHGTNLMEFYISELTTRENILIMTNSYTDFSMIMYVLGSDPLMRKSKGAEEYGYKGIMDKIRKKHEDEKKEKEPEEDFLQSLSDKPAEEDLSEKFSDDNISTEIDNLFNDLGIDLGPDEPDDKK